MYKLNELKEVSTDRKGKKRLGRGRGSGKGKTCCRGLNGRNSRSGSGIKAGHEGGRKPLYLTLPIRGRTKRRWFKKFDEISIETLCNKLKNEELVDINVLKKLCMVEKTSKGFKVLMPRGPVVDFDSSVTKIIANRCSATAKKFLEEKGVSLEIFSNQN
ncbi:MAG: 50S ribosomal protein L15 [Chlamydiia bacterium]|nr:50S ribosomal protein L15 [Chlamydiia bacterium]